MDIKRKFAVDFKLLQAASQHAAQGQSEADSV